MFRLTRSQQRNHFAPEQFYVLQPLVFCRVGYGPHFDVARSGVDAGPGHFSHCFRRARPGGVPILVTAPECLQIPGGPLLRLAIRFAGYDGEPGRGNNRGRIPPYLFRGVPDLLDTDSELLDRPSEHRVRQRVPGGHPLNPTECPTDSEPD